MGLFDKLKNKGCPHDFAERFKNAIENNNGGAAADLILSWPSTDANKKYALIIYDGMPPSNVSFSELMNWLNVADSMKACDSSLKPWFRQMAIRIINMHK